MKMITPQQFNEWRIFPRLIGLFMAYMWIQFNNYFYSIPMSEQNEWAFGQYALVVGMFVGFAKIYMSTGGKKNDPSSGSH